MITEADLPLTQDGAVYHLNLLPEELADFVITVGDPGRVQQISQYFDSIEVKREHREFVTHTGFIGKKRLTVLSTGIGVPNIDIVMNELDALVNINLNTRTPHQELKTLTIIRLGTTGGLQADINIGDVVASKYAIGIGTIFEYYQHQDSKDLQSLNDAFKSHLTDNMKLSSYSTRADTDLLLQFQNLARPGITLTCNGFYGPQGRSVRAPLRYKNFIDNLKSFQYDQLKLTNIEMETSGIYGLGRLLGHRCVSLSVVLANRETGSFSKNAKQDVSTFIAKIFDFM